MLKNYFKTALRNFWANRFFSLTNITGLAIGISASLVIYLIVNYDFSFDRFEKDGNRIYRVVSDYTFSGKSFHDSGVPHALPPAVKNEVTGLETIAPFYLWNEGVKISIPFTSNNVTDWKKQKDIVFADENYFELLQYTWLAGSPKTSLTQPYEVVLTASNVKLYFPTLTNDQVIGKEMIFSDTVRTTVTGIVKDFSQNSDFSFKTFVSRATIETPRLKRHDGNEWTSASPSSQLFVRLSAGTSTAQINNQVEGLFIKYSKKNAANVSTRHHLQPLADLHFNAAYENFNQRIAHKPTLYGLLAVAAFLLLLACINFINLTTAQASKRAKEIGIRKTMGSSKKQLIFQFLTETFLLTVAAAILSLGLTPLLLKIFADFVPDGLHFNLLHQPGVWLFLLLLLVAVSLLAGFYPAIILSSYKPVLVLKKQVSANTGTSHSIWMRKSLTVSQFVIAQVFIIATMLVGKQINYTLNKDLGFKKDAVVYFTTGISDFNPEHKAFLMDKLKAIPGIEKISISNFTPSLNGHHYPASILKYKDGEKEIETQAEIKYTDSNYISLYNMKLLAGTNIATTDTINSLLINETFAHTFGFANPQQAIGKYIEWEDRRFPVIGVVADFHQKSLHETIKPVVFASRDSQEQMFNIALQPRNARGNNWKAVISKIEKAFKEIYPQEEFELGFLDQDIAKYYTAEQNISHLLIWATGLTIFISALGLLGLVIYITNQRTKEIGIRKVIGATVTQLVYLLTKDFLTLVAYAFIIAIPVAWWGTNKWLDNFAYKTTLSWWVFLAGGVTMLLMALIILSIRTIKAATENPVKSLRMD